MLAETSRYLLAAGGKRFRPMLVLLAGYFGDPADPRLIPGSVSIELVHQATLYHDDVIDEADARHGVVSANIRWDNTVAILTGDYLFARASEISTDLGTDICALLARTIATLCDGQIREVEAAGRVEQTEGAYMEIIRRKTGALIATSCRLGGMLSDAPASHVDVLEEFGEALGLAFQLSDDIMDLTASQDDAREGARAGPAGGRLHAPGAARPRGRARRGAGRPAPAGAAARRAGSGRALQIATAAENLEHARAAVVAEVDRAQELARRLPTARPGRRSSNWPSTWRFAARLGRRGTGSC